MRGLKTLEGLRHEGGYERVDLRMGMGVGTGTRMCP